MADYPWITVKLRGSDYCISSEKVVTMLAPERIHAAEAGLGMLGLITFGNEIIPYFSLRELMGLESLEEDWAQLDVIRDLHQEWFDELQRSAQAGEEFCFPLDERECGVGMWYHSFHTATPGLKEIAERIGEPHHRLHELARELQSQLGAGRREEAMKTLDKARRVSQSTLAPLLARLSESYRQLNKGIAVILEEGGAKLALQVDRVIAVTSLEGFEPTSELGFQTRGFVKTAFRAASGPVYLELDLPAVAGALR